MGDNSSIEWTATVNADGTVTPGATWNPVTGCSKVSPGCAHCYAETVADRFWATQYPPILDGRGAAVTGEPLARPRTFTDVMCHEDRLEQPLRWRRPRRIFVNSMSDLFHEDVPDAFIDRVFAVMALAPQHTFQVLTKRAERMRQHVAQRELQHSAGRPIASEALEFVGLSVWERAARRLTWPLPNVWLGVSVENQRFADERIPLLLQTPATVRFISAEPLLGPVDLTHVYIAERHYQKDALRRSDLEPPTVPDARLDWVIVGGESGQKARPMDLAWARSIVLQCQAAGVPCFVKQLGARPYGAMHPESEQVWGGPVLNLDWKQRVKDRKGGDPEEWPADLRVREMPRIAVRRRA